MTPRQTALTSSRIRDNTFIDKDVGRCYNFDREGAEAPVRHRLSRSISLISSSIMSEAKPMIALHVQTVKRD